ncbi:MAG TPA: hypothetical protein VFI27_06735 [candidate division Zixibacteria bacterium]|nr:hypothetical protein [candidate division Zixibacteria bacterium]
MGQVRTIEYPSEEALRWIIQALVDADLRVDTSFDLRTARAAHTGCSCPHHGTAACDCQMVVLLVYGMDASPATLVVHGRDRCTYLSLANIPGQRPSPELAATIFTTLSVDAFSSYEKALNTLQVR